ncbi:FAD-dependent monooxygenase [Streptomyces sp. NPDC002935]|uniref:FAD-dependent monooxygenase n=1 Tax=Streptomyces sp. NPDC002935 TaxID=3154545 RepID=UPI0033B68946
MVGGGPVGLCVAAELGGLGVRVLVVEERGSVSLRPKASVLHARSVQCLVRRGYGGDVVPVGCGVPSVGALSGGGLVGGPGGVGGGGSVVGGAVVGGGLSSVFHFGGLGGLVISAPVGEPVPVVRCVQAELEAGFERRVRGVGGWVVRGVSVVGLEEEGDCVRVVGRGSGGLVSWRARFVVGADGARGVVRELAGFGCRSWPATARALMGWVRPGGVGGLGVGWHRTGRGWVVVKDAGDGGVHVRTLNCSGAEGEGVRGRPVTLAELGREVSWIAGRDVVLGEGRWLSRFSDFSRVAGSFRRGRVLLAGDAAHVHFPIGGQGLSTGLLDAVNLGWKLALCVRGGAGEELLDSYDLERRPAALRVVESTRAQLALMRPGAELDPLRDLFGSLMRRGGAGGLGEMVSAQDTVLPVAEGSSSAWEGRFLRNVVLRTGCGVRDVIGLLRGGGPVLLLAGGRGGRFAGSVGAWSSVVRVVRVVSVPGVDCDALLVRPDGYIAWASDGGRGLDVALRALLGPGGTAVACAGPVSAVAPAGARRSAGGGARG